MPISTPAAISRRVSAMSSSLGSGSPDGWLWNTTIAAAPAAAASRNTSRGWTMLASSVPTVTHGRAHDAVLRIEQHDAELLDRPVAVERQEQLRDRARARDLHALPSARVSVRRPSSTAASTCAARADPIPGTLRELVVPRAAPGRRSPPRPSSIAFARSRALAAARP